MKLGIVLPWRATKTRIAGFEASLKRHEDTFPDVTIYKSDSYGFQFNPSEARNRGCLQAIADGCDVLAVLDADTLFQPQSVEQAARVAVVKGIVCYPYTIATELTESETLSFLDGSFNPFSVDGLGAGNPIMQHVGSGWVMTADTFHKMQGWDEHFLGWGYEDNAFQLAHRMVIGTEMDRISGVCFRLFHEERDQRSLQNNRERFFSYERATADEVKEMVLDNLVHQREVKIED